MKKVLILVALMVPASAVMAGNVGTCGWGSKLFDGQRGIAPQVLAVTTNGTSGNQTFAISTGTSGCTQDGVVRTNWKTALFIDANKTKLARDMSVGNGETLSALGDLMGVEDEDRALFYKTSKRHFAMIFPNESVETEAVVEGLNSALSSEDALKKYRTIL